MKEPINIESIPFDVNINLGIKSLLCTMPAFESVNTLIGLIEEDDYFIERLLQKESFVIQGFQVQKVKDDATKTAKNYWSRYDKASGEETFYAISGSFKQPAIYVPESFLIALQNKITECKTSSSPVPPPWLFRAPSLASYPCRLPGMEQVERELLQNFDNELAQIGNGQPGSADNDHEFREQLKLLGLLNNQFHDEKLFWLQQWQLQNLHSYYLQVAEQVHPIKDDRRLASESEFDRLETQIKELELMKKAVIRQEGEITARRRFILHNLQEVGLMEVDALIPESLKNEKRWPWVFTYYNAIRSIYFYYNSEERKQVFGTSLIPGIMDSNISLEWFLKTGIGSEYGNFYFTALCEKTFTQSDVEEGGLIFTRIKEQRIAITVQKDDGLTLRIMSYKTI